MNGKCVFFQLLSVSFSQGQAPRYCESAFTFEASSPPSEFQVWKQSLCTVTQHVVGERDEGLAKERLPPVSFLS